MHYFETATGLKFVITTDPKAPSLQSFLSKLYSDIYVEYVTKNPYMKQGEVITCNLFISILEQAIKSHASYSS